MGGRADDGYVGDMDVNNPLLELPDPSEAICS